MLVLYLKKSKSATVVIFAIGNFKQRDHMKILFQKLAKNVLHGHGRQYTNQILFLPTDIFAIYIVDLSFIVTEINRVTTFFYRTVLLKLFHFIYLL